MPELVVEIEGAFDLGLREHARDVGVGFEQALEVALLPMRQHRVALNPLVRLLAGNPFLRELEQHAA